jgi:hypothetical protein
MGDFVPRRLASMARRRGACASGGVGSGVGFEAGTCASGCVGSGAGSGGGSCGRLGIGMEV